MSAARVAFTPGDAEQKTALSVENLLNRALRMLAERLHWEKVLEADPAGFATRFAPLLAALVEAQAREYQIRLLGDRRATLADAAQEGLEELGDRAEMLPL